MIRWEDNDGRLMAYLGAHQVAHVYGIDGVPFWYPVSILAGDIDATDPHTCASVDDAKQQVEDYVRSWLQDAGLVSAPWLTGQVDAYWAKRGGSPRVGGAA